MVTAKRSRDHERTLMASIVPDLEARLADKTNPVVVLEVESDLIMELVLDILRQQKTLHDIESRNWLVREVKRERKGSILANVMSLISIAKFKLEDSSYWEDFSDTWQQLSDEVGQLLVISHATPADVRVVEKFLSLQEEYKPLVILCVGVNIAGNLLHGPKQIARRTLYARTTREDMGRYLSFNTGLSPGEEVAIRESVESVAAFISPTQLICLLRLLPVVGFEKSRSIIAESIGGNGNNASGHAVLAAVVEAWIEKLEISERLLLLALALLTGDHQRVPRDIWERTVRRLMGETLSKRWTFRLRSELVQSLVTQDGDFVRFSHSTWTIAIHAYLAKQPELFKNGIRAAALAGIGEESDRISTLARSDRRKEILLDEMTALAQSLLEILPLSFWPHIDVRMMDVIRRVLAQIEDHSRTTVLSLINKVLSALEANSANSLNITSAPYEAAAFAKLMRQALQTVSFFGDDQGKVWRKLRYLVAEALDVLHRLPRPSDAATAIELKLLTLRVKQVELDLFRLEANTSFAAQNVEAVSAAIEEVPEEALEPELELLSGYRDLNIQSADTPDTGSILGEGEIDDLNAVVLDAPEEGHHEELSDLSEHGRRDAIEAFDQLFSVASDLVISFEECAHEALALLDERRASVRNPGCMTQTNSAGVSVRLNEIIPGIYRHGARAAHVAGMLNFERREEIEFRELNSASAKANSYLDKSEMLLLRGQKHQPSNIDIQREILKFELEVKCINSNSEIDLKKTNALIEKIKLDWKVRPHPFFQDLLVNALRQYLSTEAGRNAPPPALDSTLDDLLNSALSAGSKTTAKTRNISRLISIVTVNIGNNDLAVKIFDKLIEGEHNSAILKSIIPGATQRILQQLQESAGSLDSAIRFARKLDRVAIESGNGALAEAANEGANSVYDLGLQILADRQLESVSKTGLDLKLAGSNDEAEERENLTAYLSAISDSNNVWQRLAWDSKIRHLRLAKQDRSWRDFDRLLMVELVNLVQNVAEWRFYKKSQIGRLFLRAGENEPLLRPMVFMKRLGLRREQFALACLIKSTTDKANSRRWRYEARFHTEQAEKLYRYSTAFRERIRIWRVLKYLLAKEGRYIEAGYYENYIRRAKRTIDIDHAVDKKGKWDAKAYLYAGRELMFVNGSEERGALMLLQGIARADTLDISHPLRRQLRTLYAQSFWSRLFAQNIAREDDDSHIGPPPLPSEQLERFVSGNAKSFISDLLLLAAMMPRELKVGNLVAGRISHFDQENDRLVVEYLSKSGNLEHAVVAKNVIPVTFYHELQGDPTLNNLKGQIFPISGMRSMIDEYPAASMRGGKYCYDVINLIAPKIVTTYRRSPSSKKSRMAPELSRNALVMGASNSWLVFRIHPDFAEMFRNQDGLLIKQLPPVLGLRRITFSKFSLEYDAGEYKRAELEDFISAAWSGCSILSWNWREKRISIKAPGWSIDSRKSRTFAAMLKKAFPYDVKTVQLL